MDKCNKCLEEFVDVGLLVSKLICGCNSINKHTTTAPSAMKESSINLTNVLEWCAWQGVQISNEEAQSWAEEMRKEVPDEEMSYRASGNTIVVKCSDGEFYIATIRSSGYVRE
jgi:hypothetical protein